MIHRNLKDAEARSCGFHLHLQIPAVGFLAHIKFCQRIASDRAAWEKQKQTQREQMLQRVRQQRVQQYVASLREAAKIEDRRKIVKQNARQATG